MIEFATMTGQPETHHPFRAVLTPNCSLSSRGFAIIMAIVCIVSFTAGLAFLLLGAWPVFGFFGLDAAIIYWAFKRNFRDAARREIIEVTPYEVIVQRLCSRGRLTEQRFTRPWVQIGLERNDERELVGALTLSQGGRHFEIGRFLGPEERTGFFHELRRALA